MVFVTTLATLSAAVCPDFYVDLPIRRFYQHCVVVDWFHRWYVTGGYYGQKFQYCWTSGSTSLVSNTMGLTVHELPCRVETWYAGNQNGGNKGTQNCDLRF
jgi:hypothetical protein